MRLKYTTILLLLLSISCGGKFNYVDNESNDSTKIREQKKWELIYFKEITERIDGTEIKNLKDLDLPPDSKEIRIWVGFNASSLRGLVLRQDNKKWSAYYVPPVDNSFSSERNYYLLPPPKSGWDAVWERLHDLELMNLPDSVDIGMQDKYIDDLNVIVEIKTCASYRTYRLFGFDIPGESSREPVRKMLKICNFLSDEFGVLLYY